MKKKPTKIDKGQFETEDSFDALGVSKKIVGGEFDGYEAQQMETASKTHLEDDVGYGNAAIIRCFEFGINPMAFREHRPTKQELFNSHLKGIEVSLWKDGLKVLPEVNPRIVIEEKTYKIFVGAAPSRGHLLNDIPKTLSQIAHG